MQELIVFKKFAMKIGVSPLQIAEIQKIRSSKEFEKRYNQELIALSKARKPINHDLILAEFDPDVKKELLKVLSEFQVDSLRKEWLKTKFKYGWTPFDSREVLDFCNLDENARQRLKEQVAKELKIFESQCEERTDSAISEVTKLLPASARKPFVHYCGTRFFPFETLDPDFSPTIPFHKNAKSLGAMTHIAAFPSMRQAVGLTDEQAARIAEISRSQMRQSFDIPDVASIYEAASKRAIEVLPREQQVKAFRVFSLFEFRRDFASPFSTPGFVSFLGLSTTDAQALKSIATEESDDLAKELHELNKNLFSKLCDELSETNRTMLKVVFHGVW